MYTSLPQQDRSRRPPTALRPPGRESSRVSPALHPVLQLQQTIGNRAVRRWLQTKLAVSAPGDAYEQEADRVADAVMTGQAPAVSPASPGVQPELRREIARPEDLVDSTFPPGGEILADSAAPKEKGPEVPVQRSVTGEAGEGGGVSAGFESALDREIQRGGEALPAGTGSFMESRFGQDFSGVRIHRDAQADTLARSVDARAFTVGSDIFFARAQYQPESSEGRHLLAHELTHVVQQSPGLVARQGTPPASGAVTACSKYKGYDSSVSLTVYNCAGLALRTYTFIAPAADVRNAIAANFKPATGSGGANQVKFWLWEYTVHTEDDKGKSLGASWDDFHIVAGLMGAKGKDPKDVYSKNGRRPVYGPGTGPGFKPAARERATSNDPSEKEMSTNDGRPIFKVRSMMTETILTAECNP